MSSATQPNVAVRETHTAIVLLMGDRAYKVKKPVDLGFLDFRTEPARSAACHREVELNRRLTPDVYLGVADVIGPDGVLCDHMVVMRRMPDDRRLSALVSRDAEVADALRRVAHMVAAFHARSERTAQMSQQGSRDALRGRWTATFNQLRPFHETVLTPPVAQEVERLTLRYLEGREPLFASRIEERLGAPELAAAFLDWYIEFAGDPAPPSLLHHYLAYRAYVRAKVACLHTAQGDHDAAGDARRHAELAHRHPSSETSPSASAHSPTRGSSTSRPLPTATLPRHRCVRRRCQGRPAFTRGVGIDDSRRGTLTDWGPTALHASYRRR